MKATTLKINGTRIVPIDTVRFIKPLTDEDRNRAGERLEIDASKFNVRIEFADKTTKLAVETVEQIQGQGVGLVAIGGDRYVPAVNIRAAEKLTERDMARMKESGDYTLKEEFKSRVETTAGSILSTETAEIVVEWAMGLRDKAHGQGPQAASASQAETTEAPPRAKSARGGKGPKSAMA